MLYHINGNKSTKTVNGIEFIFLSKKFDFPNKNLQIFRKRIKIFIIIVYNYFIVKILKNFLYFMQQNSVFFALI